MLSHVSVVPEPVVFLIDVDNTLLDWQELWYQTFSAMTDKVLEISGVSAEVLYAQCSVVHQRYGTSEATLSAPCRRRSARREANAIP